MRAWLSEKFTCPLCRGTDLIYTHVINTEKTENPKKDQEGVHNIETVKLPLNEILASKADNIGESAADLHDNVY